MANINGPITGIVLAGGKSSRMGFDKGMAELNGKPMVAWVITALQAVCSRIIIISHTENYRKLGYPVYKDIYSNTGPVGGIFTGLTYTSTEFNLIVACDMPFINPYLFSLLLKYAGNYSIVVPSLNDRLEPLCAFYHKDILPKVEELILQQTLKMQHVIKQFNYKEIKLEDVQANSHMFANINTPQDLKVLIRRKVD